MSLIYFFLRIPLSMLQKSLLADHILSPLQPSPVTSPLAESSLSCYKDSFQEMTTQSYSKMNSASSQLIGPSKERSKKEQSLMKLLHLQIKKTQQLLDYTYISDMVA